MSSPFNKLDWYWVVGNKNPATDVFSSRRYAYVPQASDADYLQFTGLGNQPYWVSTELELLVIMAARPPYGTQVTIAEMSVNTSVAAMIAGSTLPSSISYTLKGGDVVLLGKQ